jgi:hypothetical protein
VLSIALLALHVSRFYRGLQKVASKVGGNSIISTTSSRLGNVITSSSPEEGVSSSTTPRDQENIASPTANTNGTICIAKSASSDGIGKPESSSTASRRESGRKRSSTTQLVGNETGRGSIAKVDFAFVVKTIGSNLGIRFHFIGILFSLSTLLLSIVKVAFGHLIGRDLFATVFYWLSGGFFWSGNVNFLMGMRNRFKYFNYFLKSMTRNDVLLFSYTPK